MRYVFVGVILLGLVSGLAIASDCGGTWSGMYGDHCNSRNADGDLYNPSVVNTTSPLTDGPSSTVYGVEPGQFATSDTGLFLIDENDEYRPSPQWQIVRFDQGETWRTPVNSSTYINNITYANDTLYVSRTFENSSGFYIDVVARDPETGQKRWEVTGPRTGGIYERRDRITKTMYHQGRLVIVTQGASGGDVYLEIKDGEIVEKHGVTKHWLDIYHMSMMDGDLYGVLSDRSTDVEKVVRYDPDTDSVISNVTKTEIDNRGNNPNDIHQIVSQDGQVMVMLEEGDDLGHTVISYDSNLSHQWTYVGPTTDYDQPLAVVDNDSVYIGTTDIQFSASDESHFVAINRTNGEERWRTEVDFSPLYTMGHGDDLVSVDENRAYIVSKNGTVKTQLKGTNVERAIIEGDTIHLDREQTITTYDSTVRIFYNNKKLYTNEFVGTEDGVEST